MYGSIERADYRSLELSITDLLFEMAPQRSEDFLKTDFIDVLMATVVWRYREDFILKLRLQYSTASDN